MKRRLTFAADQASRKPLDERVIRDVDIQHRVDSPAKACHHLVERDRLFHRSREPVEQNTLHRVRLRDALPQHRDRDRVWYQRALRHVLIGAQAQLGFSLEMIAEQVAGGDVGEPEFASQVGRLGPAGSRCAQKDEVHAGVLCAIPGRSRAGHQAFRVRRVRCFRIGHVLRRGTEGAVHHFLTGNRNDVSATTRPGLGLMGGGTDVDALFTWMGERAGGGDFVVIRASGGDGYNRYVYDLAPFDSVETLVLKDRAASSDAFVLRTIRNAEALFIAGGDQSNYVNYWKGTPVEDAIHSLARRGVPIAGTSAGTAIMSEFIYAAQGPESVTSIEALADPFSRNITLDRDFLILPHMQGIITDQHLIERDRLGRTLTFMARIVADSWSKESKAIAIDRETAVLIDGHTAQATIVANADHAMPFAYFIRGGAPQVVELKTPLTYTNLQVQRARPGNTFNVLTWTGTGVVSYTLNVVDGSISSTQPGGSIY